ncbi:putative Ig domain-containing protein [Agrobacterium sp. SHOUNA12C]|nr:putative Ig domain-containing protein [Agrobacterium sp. BETTINA12B]MCJ9759752.1 putative Ig domain-containing protein [Agrobacterium sp. SHOUNA12C]
MTRIPLMAAAIAALLATSASASEPRILYRSATTGTIAAPVTSEPLPPIEAPGAISIKYANNGRTFPRGMSMSLSPMITGGSGQYEFAFASGTAFPAGITFSSATGIFSGKPQAKGDYTFHILLHDLASGQYVTAVVRFFVA